MGCADLVYLSSVLSYLGANLLRPSCVSHRDASAIGELLSDCHSQLPYGTSWEWLVGLDHTQGIVWLACARSTREWPFPGLCAHVSSRHTYQHTSRASPGSRHHRRTGTWHTSWTCQQTGLSLLYWDRCIQLLHVVPLRDFSTFGQNWISSHTQCRSLDERYTGQYDSVWLPCCQCWPNDRLTLSRKLRSCGIRGRAFRSVCALWSSDASRGSSCWQSSSRRPCTWTYLSFHVALLGLLLVCVALPVSCSKRICDELRAFQPRIHTRTSFTRTCKFIFFSHL